MSLLYHNDEQKSKRTRMCHSRWNDRGLVKHIEMDKKVKLSEQMKENVAHVTFYYKLRIAL